MYENLTSLVPRLLLSVKSSTPLKESRPVLIQDLRHMKRC